MSKPLDPEIKAMRALDRAMRPVPQEAKQRVLEWAVAYWCGVGAVRLPRIASESAPQATPEEEVSGDCGCSVRPCILRSL